MLRQILDDLKELDFKEYVAFPLHPNLSFQNLMNLIQ